MIADTTQPSYKNVTTPKIMKSGENITIIINITADGSKVSNELISKYLEPIVAKKKADVFDPENINLLINSKFDLTERESQVLGGMIKGLKNNEIADELFISVSTVKYHSRKVFEKLEINTRNQAISKIHQLLSTQ
ncbi:helix-turn-helix transcriptional regulator [Agrobacterium tumefaciens]|nr:helix-turn-helix transcriptional regulator [Agrobacterium tumefaciens]NTE22275.1 helix-turn-helix transcriptional regulator [Agrobacterium tumefaciens]